MVSARKSVKNQLLLWCQLCTTEYDNVTITNLSTSFRDGLALCAILHHFDPKAIPFSTLSANNPTKNVSLALKVAKKHFGIPDLIDVEDVTIDKPDAKIMFTCLSVWHEELEKNRKTTASSPPKASSAPKKSLPSSKVSAKKGKSKKQETLSAEHLQKLMGKLLERYRKKGKIAELLRATREGRKIEYMLPDLEEAGYTVEVLKQFGLEIKPSTGVNWQSATTPSKVLTPKKTTSMNRSSTSPAAKSLPSSPPKPKVVPKKKAQSFRITRSTSPVKNLPPSPTNPQKQKAKSVFLKKAPLNSAPNSPAPVQKNEKKQKSKSIFVSKSAPPMKAVPKTPPKSAPAKKSTSKFGWKTKTLLSKDPGKAPEMKKSTTAPVKSEQPKKEKKVISQTASPSKFKKSKSMFAKRPAAPSKPTPKSSPVQRKSANFGWKSKTSGPKDPAKTEKTMTKVNSAPPQRAVTLKKAPLKKAGSNDESQSPKNPWLSSPLRSVKRSSPAPKSDPPKKIWNSKGASALKPKTSKKSTQAPAIPQKNTSTKKPSSIWKSLKRSTNSNSSNTISTPAPVKSLPATPKKRPANSWIKSKSAPEKSTGPVEEDADTLDSIWKTTSYHGSSKAIERLPPKLPKAPQKSSSNIFLRSVPKPSVNAPSPPRPKIQRDPILPSRLPPTPAPGVEESPKRVNRARSAAPKNRAPPLPSTKSLTSVSSVKKPSKKNSSWNFPSIKAPSLPSIKAPSLPKIKAPSMPKFMRSTTVPPSSTTSAKSTPKKEWSSEFQKRRSVFENNCQEYEPETDYLADSPPPKGCCVLS